MHILSYSMMNQSVHSYVHIIRCVAIVSIVSLVCACQESNTDQGTLMDTESTIASSQSDVSDLKAPQMNFGKSDRTDDAQLKSKMISGQSGQGQALLAQVYPIQLNAGDQVKLYTWSDQAVGIYVFKPGKAQNWTEELLRAKSNGVQIGMESKELMVKAEASGDYAIAIQPLTKEVTQFIVNIQCQVGPCLSAIEKEKDRVMQENVEAIDLLRE